MIYKNNKAKSCSRAPGIVARAYRTHRNSGYGYERHAELTEVPGTGMNAVQNLQKFFAGQNPGQIPRVRLVTTLQNTTFFICMR